MAFDKKKIKLNYSTANDNVAEEFYIPVLKEAIKHDIAVGYFTTNGLLMILQGIEGLVKNNGKMRILIGDPLTQEEYDALDGNSYVHDKFDEIWREIFNGDFSEIEQYRLEIFSWLCNKGYLKIKYASRVGGMYHKKIGILEDENGDQVVFNGSMNLTRRALISNEYNPDGNSEEFSVYPSWIDGFYNWGKPKIEDFEKAWNGNEPNTKVYDLPSKAYQNIKKHYQKPDFPKLPLGVIDPPKSKLPYELRAPQKKALKKWQDNNYKGILALATGSGKTITAIHAAVEAAKKETLCVIIAVPYIVLAEQWIEVLNKYSIEPYECFGNSNKWYSSLSSAIGRFNLGIKKFLPIVVVNATLNGKKFQTQLKKIESSNHGKIFMISDECHHHANENTIKNLPKAKYILGLSATPWNKDDEESRVILKSYYDDIVEEYTLDMALEDGWLCPYSYQIHEVEMNRVEEEEYLRLTRLISSLYKQKTEGTLSSKDKSILDNTIFKRARLLDGVEDKFETLNEILKSKKPSPYKLFYCGSGFQASYEDEDESGVENDSIRIIDRITSILADRDWNVSKFTSEESHHDRRNVLQTFKNKQIDAIAAIKVLDEGFDVPMCNEAYFTASSSSERQWVQRRGRILRKSDNKESAIVHDFVITKTSSTNDFKDLIGKEMARVDAFFKSCSNQNDIKDQIQTIKNTYLIETKEGV
jgi:superfamily II DNA or RNA helicase